MEVKRAFRCYRGPDDPGPFSDIINSMSFGCRHMKEFNRNGVFCLTAKVPEGYVKVLRVGDVDYVDTYHRQEDYLVFHSSKGPFIYVYDTIGNLCWRIDPREKGNYADWYQWVHDTLGPDWEVWQLTAVLNGDPTGFDLLQLTGIQWAFYDVLQRFTYGGGLVYQITFPYLNEETSKWGCSFAITKDPYLVTSVLYMVPFIDDPSDDFYKYRNDLNIYKWSDNSFQFVTALTLTNNQNYTGGFFWQWSEIILEDNCFYVGLYGRTREPTEPRWLGLMKLDYEGNILKQTTSFQLTDYTGGIFAHNYDYYTGLLKRNDSYVIYFSSYGQYIRVWDKDLNFIKNIEIPPNFGYYGQSTGWPYTTIGVAMLGFIKNEVYILVHGYDRQGVTTPSGYEEIYVYDVSKDAGDEFQRVFKIYPPVDVEICGDIMYEIFNGGFTLEGYKG